MKYITFYSSDNLIAENRIHVLAATNKIDYICKAINNAGINIEIISPSWTINKKGYYKGNNIKINDGTYLKTFSTFGSKNKIVSGFKQLWSLLSLTFFLLMNTEKNEKIIVYHSSILSIPIRFVKAINKLILILEVEEIYSNVQPSYFWSRQELKLIESADKYIFPTVLLNEKLNTGSKPYAIIHGTYEVEQDKKYRYDDGKIHIVYAGTFDPRKGGATTAVAMAAFLPESYHIHIIGFGTKKEISDLSKQIEEVAKDSEATITYHGLLRGEEYIRFLQRCDIGLSTQNPNGDYNLTSFPSKILSYMSNGLRVVTIRIKVVENSDIGNEVFYYNKQDPVEIANVINNIDLIKPYDSRKIIQNLNEKFIKDIKGLLEG